MLGSDEDKRFSVAAELYLVAQNEMKDERPESWEEGKLYENEMRRWYV